MANTKEVRKQIASIKSTRKITSALEMVAASKIKKTQEQMLRGRPYSEKVKDVIGHIANSSSEYDHPFYQDREAKTVCYVIVSSDKGLCGGLNTNLFKKVLVEAAANKEQGVEVSFALIGGKAVTFFGNLGGKILSQVTKMGDKPNPEDLIGFTKVILDEQKKNSIDKVILCSNRFVNTMTQEPTLQQLIPLVNETNEGLSAGQWDYIYEPEAKTLLDGLLTRYIEALIFQAVLENGACEQAAKMIAMKNATENAGDLIKELELLYNNVRRLLLRKSCLRLLVVQAAV